MATNKNSSWKLGIFIAVGLAIFIFFIFFIGKNKNVFSSTVTLHSYFDNVGGLAVGNNVRFAGIKVGSVTSIAIENDTTIRVDIIVEEDVQKFIKQDSKLAIGSDGLMGDKVINLIQGSSTGESVKDGGTLVSTKPFDTDKLMASLQKTVYNAETLSGEIAQITRKMNSKNGIIGRLLDDSTFSKSMDKTMGNLEKASGGLSQNMDAAQNSFLLRGYFKKKKKAKLQKEEDQKEKAEDDAKKKQEESDEKIKIKIKSK